MFRGLYKEGYSLFENNIPPKTITGVPFGVTAFSDEKEKYFKNINDRQQEKIALEIDSRPLPKHFDILVSLRCNVSSFVDFAEGMQSTILLRRISDYVFSETPIIPNATSRCLADALIALSLEGHPLDRKGLDNQLLATLTHFPNLYYYKSPAKNAIKEMIGSTFH